MADITHNDPVVTESKLTEFYNDIKPFLGCPAYVTQEGDAEYYSTDEKVIGRWTDGKPLYQRTLTQTIPTTTDGVVANTELDISSWNIDKVISISATFPFTLNGTKTSITACPYYRNNQGQFYRNNIYNNKLITATDYAAIGGYTSTITVHYTKTTDSASTTIEQKSTHYSTDEQVVGTWIDGKPIYQKTIDVGAMPNATSKIVNHNIPNIDQVTYVYGREYVVLNGIRWTAPIPNGGLIENNPNTTIGDMTSIFASNIQIFLTTNTDKSGRTAIVTLQYTKTTD